MNWIPEVWFTDNNNEEIEGAVPKVRYELTCNVCKRKGGACIQCDYKSCSRSYHVRCATEADIIERLDIMKERRSITDDQEDMPIFCHEHNQCGIQTYKGEGIEGLRPAAMPTQQKAKNQVTYKNSSEVINGTQRKKGQSSVK